MRFTLRKISLNNFKGFEKMDVEFSPESTLIEGDNETGKTTLYDAFCYCLSKKSSDGSTDFGIKPNFATEIVSPSVEVEAEIDEKPVTLKRVYQAKFTRDKKFSGYKTECFINGIPTGIKEFERYIADSVGEEEVFKLLTFPNYFTELMTTANGETVSQRQCKALKHMANVESDKSIAESEEAFQPLLGLLKRYDSVDDIQKFYKSEVKRIHQQIDDIPIRVEQQAKNILKVEKSEAELNTMLSSVSAKIDALRTQSAPTPESMSQVNSIKEQLESARQELAEAQNKESRLMFDEKNQYIEQLSEIRNSEHKNNRKVSDIESQIKSFLVRIDGLTASKNIKSDRIREDSGELEGFNNSDAYICPTCGSRLESDNPTSKDLKRKHETLKKTIHELHVEIESIEKEIEESQNAIDDLSVKKADLQKELGGLAESEAKLQEEYKSRVESIKETVADEIQSKRSTVDFLEKELKAANARCDEELKRKFSEIAYEQAKVEDEKQKILLELNKIDSNRRCQKMIEELEESRDKYSAELDTAQMYLDLSEEFIKKRSKLLEDAVNKLFDNVRFKFTREAKSGKVSESCIPTFNGQNYQDLSASTKLICNLDIVKGFQRYYNAYLPLFIDNAEGITETLDCDTQTVLLSVKKEVCPKCGGETGRKQENGFWKCKKCGYEFKKHFEVKEN